ncbi:MAG: nicotinamide mononucleotide transporter [Flavobacteriales bacterium]|nr:nicotinamide mononucleotide transporter [Flavobacteriales bacterium]
MDVWSEIVSAAQNMSELEILGVTFGVLSVWFSKKENILVYPTGIISVLIYVYLCFEIGLYADMGINVFYFGMSVYGWVNWKKKKEGEVLSITKNTRVQNIYSVALIATFWVIIYFILIQYTKSTVPFVDSFTTAICLVGMWLMALKKIENWIMWIVADVISIPLYWYKGLPLSSIQFLLFTALAISGFLEWRRKLIDG